MIDRGDVYYIFMTPDADWLADESRVYPITIDPQVTTSASAPTLLEKQAILSYYTANATFNSFAAEVQFHAAAAYDWKKNYDQWYLAAIRADMAIGEETESGFYDQYYILDSEIVQAQINEHGEY